VKQEGALDSASSKGFDKPVFRKQRAILANFIFCYQIFVTKNLLLKFMYIYIDD